MVGPYIIKGLIEKRADKKSDFSGCDITVISRGNKEVPYKNQIEHIIADVNDKKACSLALENRYFDVVIDDIAYSPQSVINVLSNLKTKRYIQISTMGVYKLPQKLAKETEFSPFTYHIEESGNDYGERKRMAEAVAYQMFPECNPVVIRPGYVTNPENPLHRLNVRLWEVVYWIKKGIPINPGYNEMPCTFTNVFDEAGAILKLMEDGYEKPLNIACEKIITVSEILAYIERRCGIKAIYSDCGKIHGFPSGGRLDISECLKHNIQISKLDDWFWGLLDFYIDTEASFLDSWEIIKGEMDSGCLKSNRR